MNIKLLNICIKAIILIIKILVAGHSFGVHVIPIGRVPGWRIGERLPRQEGNKIPPASWSGNRFTRGYGWGPCRVHEVSWQPQPRIINTTPKQLKEIGYRPRTMIAFWNVRTLLEEGAQIHQSSRFLQLEKLFTQYGLSILGASETPSPLFTRVSLRA